MLIKLMTIFIFSYAYAGEYNMKLLNSYANTLEQKIWSDCIAEKDITERLDFVNMLPKTLVEKDFYMIKNQISNIHCGSTSFQLFANICEKIINSGDNIIRISVTELFKMTSEKYFSTMHKMEKAKKIDQTIHREVSTDEIAQFLRADKSSPVMIFA
ncbi:MAG: hypothetical protein FADNKDHG_01583 [Holosporales bacterium]